MNQEIEIEFKNMLTGEEFERIKQYFKLQSEDFIAQENHYLDTMDFLLKAKNAALRIRKKQGVYTLTLKQPLEKGLLESHQLISEQQALALFNGSSLSTIKGEINTLISTMGIEPNDIVYLGSLRTQRAEIKLGDHLLVLDHSFYFNKEDFELEFEVKDYDIGKKEFINLLQKYNIPLRDTRNKIVRFFMEKENQ
ncbi:CYTH domain-containing protein [Bacillus sp. Marseille-P3661]|uniref:CYTH domain-containing protein n=1 Tax=Bacillus sp. Marseille-P3661 TaxID=1936234 RepID=UPI000C84EEA7|nr:CYTH domain-containing protein [Bacillus sp. Marseille-P3661]